MHQVVLAALACPNLPLEPILATTQTVGADGRPLKRYKQTVTTPSSVSKPLEQSVAGSQTGCLFTAVQDQGAFQAALFADGKSCGSCVTQQVSFVSLDNFDLTPLASPRFPTASCPSQNLLMVFHPSLHLCQLASLTFSICCCIPSCPHLCLTVCLIL